LTIGIGHGNSDGQIWLRYFLYDMQLNNLVIDVSTIGIAGVPLIQTTNPGFTWRDVPDV